MQEKQITRSPYTLSSDLIRAHSETQISRSDASQIREVISKALGLDDEFVATKLAEYYTANKEAIDVKAFNRFVIQHSAIFQG